MYALKKIKLGGLKPKEFDNSINEIRILASIENPYIICKNKLSEFELISDSLQRRLHERQGK